MELEKFNNVIFTFGTCKSHDDYGLTNCNLKINGVKVGYSVGTGDLQYFTFLQFMEKYFDYKENKENRKYGLNGLIKDFKKFGYNLEYYRETKNTIEYFIN